MPGSGERRVSSREVARRAGVSIATVSFVLNGRTKETRIPPETEARVLFFDEPARGIDVDAKAEMFELIGELAAQGRAVVLISSYLPELINMCDRILVMREGAIVGAIDRSEFSEERIIALATGVQEAAA